MTETSKSPKETPPINDEEYQKIFDEVPNRSLHVIGMLVNMRKRGLSLEEALEDAISVESSKEHEGAYKEAHEYLVENKDFFGLESEKEE